MIPLRYAVALLLASQVSTAGACGFCIEDKVASVYDHAVVTQALERQHHVAFFAIDGPIPPGDRTQRALAAMAEATKGVDKGNVRVSVESAALSAISPATRSAPAGGPRPACPHPP